MGLIDPHWTLAAETTLFGIILFTADFAACELFYEVTLGLPVMQRRSALTMFAFGGGYLLVEDGGFGSPHEKDRTRNPTVLRFNVDDAEAVGARLAERDVAVSLSRHDWGTVAAFCDPDGNRCEAKSPVRSG